jgi:type II secretory pathway pseudopilin PulG
MSESRAKHRCQRGYALLIMLVLMVSGSLYALLNQLTPAVFQAAQNRDTANALKHAKEALLAYAVTYRDQNPNSGFGYLPCPDLASDDTSLNGFLIGTEVSNCSNKEIGLLPYKSLGLPDLRDGNGDCLWYAVSPTHRSNPKYIPTLSASTNGQYEIADATGNLVVRQGGPERGIAAVVISPGKPIGQQDRGFIDDKPCQADSNQITAYLESQGPVFTQGSTVSANGDTLKNDRIVWLTAKEIFERAQRRSDYNDNAPIP